MADLILKYGSDTSVSTGWGGGPALAYNEVFTSADIDLVTGTAGEYYGQTQTSVAFVLDANFAAGDTVTIGWLEVRPDATAVYPGGLNSAAAQTSTAATVARIKGQTHVIESVAVQAASETMSIVSAFIPRSKKIKMVVWVTAASASAQITGSTWYVTPILDSQSS